MAWEATSRARCSATSRWKLYRHEIGGVRIEQGVDDSELITMLKTIARETVKGAPELKTGAHAGATLRDWPHIDLLPLSYDQLRLHDDNAPPDDTEKGGGWATQLWSKLARSAVGPGGSEGVGDPDLLQDPLALASTIDRHENDPAFDKGILGLFGSFVDEIRAKGGSAAKGLRVRVGSLVSGMAPATLRRILTVNTDFSQRRQLVMNATHALAADTVLDLAKAASDATQHSMSEALLLLLAKLARHSDKGSAARKEKADAALRENVRQLINDWDKAAELPEENYWATMEKLIAEPGKEVKASGMYDVPPEHVVQLSLETEVFGTTTRAAVSGDDPARPDRGDARDGGRDARHQQGGLHPAPPFRQHRHDPPAAARPAGGLRSALPPREPRRIPGRERAARRARA